MAEFIPPSNWDGVPNIENYAKIGAPLFALFSWDAKIKK